MICLSFFENLLEFFFGLSFFGLEFYSKCPKKAWGIGPPEMSVRDIIVVFRIFLIAPIDSELS